MDNFTYYYHPHHYADEETGLGRLSHLLKVTHLVMSGSLDLK